MRYLKLVSFTAAGILLIFFISGMSEPGTGSTASVQDNPDSFGDYWYQGEAELNRYNLKQFRYGEMREGDAVLVFVTEDFLTDKQVKYEYGPKPKSAVTVLKMNAMRKFITGIYPYSLMTSVFTPVQPETGPTLKVTTSVQEWCGHTFTQFNYRKDRYEVLLRSYFQKEGDETFKLDDVLLEDEVWTRIRLNPESLPVGETRVIPGTVFQRLAHHLPEVEPAEITREKVQNSDYAQDQLVKYRIAYDEIDRHLSIYYTPDFPHEIIAWEETYGRENNEGQTTRAVRTHVIKGAYWNMNSVADLDKRQQLGLD